MNKMFERGILLAAIMPLMMSDGAEGAAAGGTEGGGGDADIFGDAGAGAGGDGGAGGGAGAGGGGGSAAGGEAASGAWLEQFSADAIDADNPSHRDWLSAKGFKSLDDVVKSYRDTERAFRAGDKITIPKEGASAEELAEYHRKIGVPETPEGYEFKLPDGVTGELDTAMLGDAAAQAHKLGIPKGALEAFVRDWYIPRQMDIDAAAVAARNSETQQLFKEWGGDADRNKALCNRAAARLGLDRDAIGDIQQGFGARRTFELMLKLGQGMAEDAFFDGGGRQQFGISPAEAKTQKDAMLSDPETSKKLRDKDPEATARLDRLQKIIASDMDQQQRRASA